MDLLLSKYLAAQIRYKGISRIEEYPYPEAALREASLNAITHKDYSSGNPVQIKVYEDKIIFWNAGQLPESWTVHHLMKEVPSIPFNPDVATAFFRAGLIEAWGRGTLKIIEEALEMGLPMPVFSHDSSGFRVEFSTDVEKMSGKMSGENVGENAGENVGENVR